MEKKFVIVPLGGNSFITNKPQSAGDGITPNGWTGWNDEKNTISISKSKQTPFFPSPCSAGRPAKKR